ncbi:MAG: DNA recombination protein RmuC [Deltaproteobacteria bacterium]|nr:DNA recombination protein RmuC [Deltaproteobacteria bacterium]
MEQILIIVLLFIIFGLWIAREYYNGLNKKALMRENEQFKIKAETAKVITNKTEEENIRLKLELNDAKKQVAEYLNNIMGLKEKLAKVETGYNISRKKEEEQKKEFANIKEKLKTDFENLANEIFEIKSEKFVRQNRSNIGDILEPLNLKIKEFKEKIEKNYDAQIMEGAQLREQIKNLTALNLTMSKEAKNLTNALKGDNKAMGSWGELVLEKVLERSGLEKGREYIIKEMFFGEEKKRFYPDVIINLPDKKHLIIDSKVSLVSYERYCANSDEEVKERDIKEHINSIKRHINELSKKRYDDLYKISSPDFVMLFIPIDSALIAALQKEPNLFDEAFDKNIFLTSPAITLFALRTIAALWKREKQNKNAMEIAKRGGLLYDKFALFYDQLLKVGDYMDKANLAWADSLAKLKTGKGNLMTHVEKIKQLGAKASKNLPNDEDEV